MSKGVKFLIGLAVAVVAGFISHGPLGRGAAFIDRLDGAAQAVVTDAGVPGVTVAMQRDPLARKALLSGPADKFQREGQGSLLGLDRLVLSIPGMSRIEWTNPPP
jgi:hypothetical protein